MATMKHTSLGVARSSQAKRGFYPTPEALAYKLLDGIDWHYVQSVLEPSAGAGDLANIVAGKLYKKRRSFIPYDERTRMEANREADIDCIEIDPGLRDTLNGAGHRVVHDDFMTFETQKRYDLVVMNPPFEHGAEHLLKALDLMQRGGIIRCILNAETVRNPFTTARQELLKKLGEYGASIEYVENAFSHAIRETDVEVAVIKLEIPKVKRDSTIMEDMRKAPTYKAQEVPQQYAEIVQYNQIDEWVNRYNYEVACGIRLIEEYWAMEPFILSDFQGAYNKPILSLTINTKGGRNDSATINSYIRQTRGKYWRAIFQQKAFTEKLTTNLLQELQDNVSELMDYDFSVHNIMTLMIKMSKKVVCGVEETILKLFDEWTGKYHWSETTSNRHYYDGWRTNDCFSVNKKVIIPMYGAYDDWSGDFRAYNVQRKFEDIEKVFDFLDCGRTDWPGTVSQAFQKAEEESNTKNIDTKYFTVTIYKKGTAHLIFKDMDLLEKFNLFAGQRKGWLPPRYGKKRYADMTAEEQHVVDSFQGKERYEHVMQNAAFYIETTQNQPLLLLGS